MFDNCTTVADFDEAAADLDMAKERHLRAAGWQHTSTTPGCYWMWRRRIGDVDWFVDFDTAWRIQRIHEQESPPQAGDQN